MKFISIILELSLTSIQSSTSAGLRSVSHKAAVLWNVLPLTLKRMTSSTAFKCNSKNIFCHFIETIYVFVLISYL